MFETIIVVIEGKLVAINVQISEETREVDGEQYHLVRHDTDSQFQYLATEKAVNKLRKSSTKASQAMDELAETL